MPEHPIGPVTTGRPDSLDRRLSDARVAYDGPGLREEDLALTPLEQFRRWYDDARAHPAIAEPNAMSLATVDAAAAPTVRTVLLKNAGAEGFTFFTNYDSRKGAELAERPAAAFVLPWVAAQRQVAVRGTVGRVTAEATRAYFGTRPWGSRIGAWASHQSAPVEDRAIVEARYREYAARWPDRGGPDDVPVPPHWGGYLIRPSEVEFWQGRPSRLHDRLVFRGEPGARLDDAAAWTVVRREP